MHNFYYLLKTYLVSIYLVDVVFAKDPEGSLWAGTRWRTAVLVAFLLAVPQFLLHWWDSKKIELNLQGDLCTYFQTCIFTRYFNYTDKARRRNSTAEIQYCINKEACELVEAGFMKIFEVVNMIGKLIIFTGFVLNENPGALWVIVLYPVCMALWLCFRVHKLIESSEEVVNGENSVADGVQTAVQLYHLITDYGKRPHVAKKLREKVTEMNDSMKEREAVACTSEKFTSWMSTGLISIYIIVYSQAVLDGQLSLGAFLAMVKLFGELGESFEKAFSLLMDFFAATGPLQKVTRFLNCQVDLEDSFNRNRQELKESMKLRKEIKRLDPSLSSEACVDTMPILINKHMRFNYAKFEGGEKEVSWTLCSDQEIKIDQGKLVAIFGPHSSGKATMVKLLSGAIFPTSGHVCVPSHLRRLHVSQDPVLLETGLFGNLLYGLNKVQKIAMSTRSSLIVKLLNRFQGPFADLQTRFEAELADESTRDGESAALWRDTLSFAHIALINILRGVVMNPELMVIDRPLINFGGNTQHILMRLLKEQVSERGLISTARMELRRPRTVIISTDYVWAADTTDERIELVESKEDASRVSMVVKNTRRSKSSGSINGGTSMSSLNQELGG
jgi:ABC-type multidrug transport system fused ATPase/permease subunit